MVESNKIENATFPNKTVLSEGNAKTKRIGGFQDGPITKNRILPVTTSFFLEKLCSSIRTSYKELI